MSVGKGLSLRARLGLGFGVVVAVMAVFSVLVVRTMADTQARFRTVYLDRVEPLGQLSDISTSLREARAVALNPNLTPEDAKRKVEKTFAVADSTWTAYLATYLTPEEAKLAEDQKTAYKTAKAAVLAEADLRISSPAVPPTEARRGAIDDALDPSLALFKLELALQIRVAKEEYDAASASYEWTRTVAIALTIFAIFVAIGCAWWLITDIGSTLARVQRRAQSLADNCLAGMARGAEAMSEGNFSVKVEPKTTLLNIDRKDELGDLARSVDALIGSAKATLAAFSLTQKRVADSVDNVKRTAESLRGGDLSARVDTAGLKGELHDLGDAINSALDGVVQPMLDANDEIRDVLSHVAAGDLTARAAGHYVGVQAEIAQALNQAVASLEETVGSVAVAVDEISVAGRQIASGAEQAADAASTQAGRVQEITANATSQRDTALIVAQSATEAKKLTIAAHTASAEGTVSLRALADALSRIRTTAEATSRVVRTIDEIAFQTNLLALNAAVEAARAGDAGRGFAVVAEEVRALAIRSSEAAKHTADLIEQSLNAVGEGTTLGEDAVTGIAKVDAQIAELTSSIERVATAADQQRLNVSGVVQALEFMTDLTVQGAATAQETSAAAEELRGQTDVLQERTASFVVSGKAAAPARRGRARVRAA